MAKVSDIKFEIKGTNYVVHVNCDSKGWFSANIPTVVSEALDIQSKIRANTFKLLEQDFHAAIDRYKKAETKQELLIAIKYLSAGRFCEYKDGSVFFNDNSDYHLSISFENNSTDAIAFHFELIIKETIDTVENLFHAKKGKDFPHWDKEQNDNPEKYYKGQSFYAGHKEWKYIPFSQAAFDSLTNAQEKIRAVSELLFKFIKQDEKKIELLLTQNKLLTQ